ncbi:MAG: DUF2891 family protein [Nitrospira sp.]|nr:DUF2891 family protein [Nitrospira sp.]
MTSGHADRSPFSWEAFCASRLDYLSALAAPIAGGVTRQDTSHPAFHGCVDWHSCIHGLYALFTVSRLTGEPRWSELAESVLIPEKLDQELSCIRNDELTGELPYGYAWFLKLAQDRQRFFRKDDLRVIAGELAGRLEAWIFSLSESAILTHARHRAYGNVSWAVLNLWEWAQWNNDLELAETLSAFTREHLLPLDQGLPHSIDHLTDEFFPAALQRTRAILAILPRHETATWLSRYLAEDVQLEPIHRPAFPHSAGLNFSRCWGFWDLYQYTENSEYRDQYVRHVVTHMNHPEYWRDDYKKYGHWVAQFGVYALAMSLDNP